MTRRADVATVAQASVVAMLGVLPVFLVGAFSLRIRSEFALSASRFGLVISIFFVATFLSARAFGHLAERMGERRGLVLAVALSGASLGGIAVSPSWSWLALALFIGGLAGAATQPSVNLSLFRRVDRSRLGLAFGIKQSAVPASTLVGGAALPLLALRLGWRPTVAAIALTVVVVAVAVGRAHRSASLTSAMSSHSGGAGMPRRSLMYLSLAGGVGAACAVALASFVVPSSVDAGLSESAAGYLLVGASVLSLLARVGLGWLSDRSERLDLSLVITGLFAAGSAGYLLLATGTPLGVVLGAALSFGLGWGWPGLFHQHVVSGNPSAPAAATGWIQTGIAAGSGAGPGLYGLASEFLPHGTAWTLLAVGSLLASCGVMLARREERAWHHRSEIRSSGL
jgi:predicted MFS family arabinose efflux permease